MMRCDGPHCTLNEARTSAVHGPKLQNERRAAVVPRSCRRLPFGRSALSHIILFICALAVAHALPSLPTGCQPTTTTAHTRLSKNFWAPHSGLYSERRRSSKRSLVIFLGSNTKLINKLSYKLFNNILKLIFNS